MPKAANSDLCGQSKSEHVEFKYNIVYFKKMARIITTGTSNILDKHTIILL